VSEQATGEVRRLLGPVRQVGYIVADIEAAAQSWVERLGIGPWRVKHGITFDECTYLGTSMDLKLSIATAYSGGIEIELIAQPGGPASMYTDFAAHSGVGAQHVCFYPADYPAALAHLLATGLDIVLTGVIGGVDFAYLADGHGQVIEIADIPMDGLASRVERASAAPTWDGLDPIVIR
jgi:catechol 2,3-dioxygenase-like lactoylglutathione lyase family enzyme